MYPSLREAMDALEPLVVCDLRDPRLTDREIELYTTWGYASSVSVPMIAGGVVVGLIELYDDAERDWHKELEFLTSVAQLVAGLFDNALLVHEVRQREALQHELVELAGALSATSGTTAIAATAAQHLRRVAGVEDCDVWLLEEGVLHCIASVDSRGRDAAVEGKRLDLASFPSTATAVGTQEPLIAETLDDPRVAAEERADLAEYGYRSMITLPLVSGTETIGIVDLLDTSERGYEVLRDYLVSAARTIAGALTNAELLEELRARNAALRELVELGDALGEADELPALSRTVATRLRKALSAEDCDIYRVDGDHMTCLASIDSQGWDGTEIGRTLALADYPLTVAALAANEPIVIGDLSLADLPDKEMSAYRRWGYRSMVSMPLVIEGRPIGLIDVFDTRVRDFTERLDFIRGVGRLLSSAFEEATLLDRLEESNRELRLLVGSSLDFSASLDHDAVLTAVAERLIEVTAADLCDVYRIDGDEIEILVSVGGHWDEDPVGQRWKLADYRTFVKALDRTAPRDHPRHPHRPGEHRGGARRGGALGLPRHARRASARPRRGGRLPRARQSRAARVPREGPRHGALPARRSGAGERPALSPARRQRPAHDPHGGVGTRARLVARPRADPSGHGTPALRDGRRAQLRDRRGRGGRAALRHEPRRRRACRGVDRRRAPALAHDRLRRGPGAA